MYEDWEHTNIQDFEGNESLDCGVFVYDAV